MELKHFTQEELDDWIYEKTRKIAYGFDLISIYTTVSGKSSEDEILTKITNWLENQNKPIGEIINTTFLLSTDGLIVDGGKAPENNGTGMFFYINVMPNIDPDMFSTIFADEFAYESRIVGLRAYSNNDCYVDLLRKM